MLGGAALLVLLARALLAALDSALAAVGLARARALAAESPRAGRARSLAALLEEREDTSSILQVLDVAFALAAGVLAAAVGAEAWSMAPALGAVLALIVTAFAALVLSSGARAVAIGHAEGLALALAPPARLLAALLRPVARLAARAARFVAGRPGQFAPPPPPLEEVERVLSEYARSAGTPSAQSTSELIQAVFRFRERVARDLMVPRTEVVAVEIGTPVPEILRLLAEEGHSRLPVYREDLDHVVGTLHARDLVPLLEHPQLIVLQDLIRPAHFVPWSKPVDQLLREMQREHIHMAVVVDEYGGVMGVCTLEDVLEEIVGDIGDEFERDEAKRVESHADGTYTVRAETPVQEFNRIAGGAIPEEAGYETVGGFLNALAGAIPVSGDRFFHRGWLFTVSEATPRRVVKVRAARVKRTGDRDAPVRVR